MFKDLTTKEFFFDLASKEPAPGGGAASASVALHGIALAQLVLHFTEGTLGSEEKEEELNIQLEELQEIHDELLVMVDVENQSFEPVLRAMALPKETEEEKLKRRDSIENALAIACDSPKAIMLCAKKGLDILSVIVRTGNPFLVSDTMAAVRFVQTAIETASYNIFINAKMMKNENTAKEYIDFVENLMTQTNEISEISIQKGMEILKRGKL